ncbi:MAG: hypothetical protein GY942_20940 [Aestuariibacter sp.]|nr:hypothetical protein [Aestuariibacter sp.]
MTIATKIIQRALGHIGVHTPVMPATDEAMDVGLDSLNDMIAEWEDEGIKLGAVPIQAHGGELSEPLGARSGIQYQLALRLAPDFPGSQVSTELVKQANLGFNKIKRRWKVIEIPKAKVRGSLPTGQGNKRYGLWDETFFEEGQEIG